MNNEKNILEQRVQKTNLGAQARAILNMPPEDLKKFIASEKIDMGEEKSIAGKKELVARAKMGDEAYERVYKPMRRMDAAQKMKENFEES